MQEKKLSTKAIVGIVVGVLAILAVILAVILMNKNKLTAMVMRLIRQEGEVALLDASGQDVVIMDNMKLYSGNALQTGSDGLVDLSLDDTKYLTIENQSQVVFEKSGKALELKLNSGRLFFNVTEKLADDETMDISTSTMVVGIRGTSGWVDAENSDLYIGDGTVRVKGINPKTGETIEAEFTAGQKVHVYLLDEDGKTVAFELENYTIEDVPREMLRNIVQYPELFERFVDATGFEPKAVIREAIIKEILPDDMVLPEEYEELLEEVIEEMKEPEEEEEEEEEPEEVEEVETPTTNPTVPPQNPPEEEPPAEEQPPAQQPAATTTETTPTTYTVTVGSATGGSGTPSPSSAEEGASVTLTATPDSGYEFSGWTVNEGGVTLANPSAASTTFTMPAANVTVTPAFTYTGRFKATVSTSNAQWGTVTVSSSGGANPETNGSSMTVLALGGTDVQDGEEITATATSTNADRYVFDHWELSGITDNSGDIRYSYRATFQMPASDVSMQAVFRARTCTVHFTISENMTVSVLEATGASAGAITNGETRTCNSEDDSLEIECSSAPAGTTLSVTAGAGCNIRDNGQGNYTITVTGEYEDVTVTITAQ